MTARHALAIVILATALFLPGCGPTEHFAEVDGVLLVQGQPAHKMRVQFFPDIAKGTKGPASFADTDAVGKFKLECRVGDETRSGAIVGWHRVVLSDLQLAESADGRGVPIRLPSQYTLAGSSPLVQEVLDRPQTIELVVP
jgi:hypothetical protein